MGEQSEPEEAAQEMAFKQVFLQLFASFIFSIFVVWKIPKIALSQNLLWTTRPNKNTSWFRHFWLSFSATHGCRTFFWHFHGSNIHIIRVNSQSWGKFSWLVFAKVEGRRWLDGGYLKGNIGKSHPKIPCNFFSSTFSSISTTFLIPLFSGGDRRSCCHQQSPADQVHLSQVRLKNLSQVQSQTNHQILSLGVRSSKFVPSQQDFHYHNHLQPPTVKINSQCLSYVCNSPPFTGLVSRVCTNQEETVMASAQW